MFYQILLAAKVERSAIISNKQDVFELPHEFPNDLKFARISKFARIIN